MAGDTKYRRYQSHASFASWFIVRTSWKTSCCFTNCSNTGLSAHDRHSLGSQCCLGVSARRLLRGGGRRGNPSPLLAKMISLFKKNLFCGSVRPLQNSRQRNKPVLAATDSPGAGQSGPDAAGKNRHRQHCVLRVALCSCRSDHWKLNGIRAHPSGFGLPCCSGRRSPTLAPCLPRAAGIFRMAGAVSRSNRTRRPRVSRHPASSFPSTARGDVRMSRAADSKIFQTPALATTPIKS